MIMEEKSAIALVLPTGDAQKNVKNSRVGGIQVPDGMIRGTDLGDTGKDDKEAREALVAICKKRAWAVAVAQLKSLPMNIIMLYFFGNSIQIYNMTMLFMLLRGSIKSICSLPSTFKSLEQVIENNTSEPPSDTLDSDCSTEEQNQLKMSVINLLEKKQLLPQKAAFVALNIACIFVVMWKCQKMGLVPSKPSDWLTLLETKKVESIAY